jgi:hypothetical protein
MYRSLYCRLYRSPSRAPQADTDSSGQLSRKEFKEALKAAELGLTRKDINLILSQIDVDRNGLVSYEEFIPVCFQVRSLCLHDCACIAACKQRRR